MVDASMLWMEEEGRSMCAVQCLLLVVELGGIGGTHSAGRGDGGRRRCGMKRIDPMDMGI